jgi:hypothetical protein
VRKVFRSSDNAVATVVQLAQEKLQALEAEGLALANLLAEALITAAPHPLPSTSRVKPGEVAAYGRPIAYELFPCAPQFEDDVLVLCGMLVAGHELKHKFLIESVRPTRFPDCKAREYVRSLWGYVDVWIEFEHRSAEYLRHGHESHTHRCDYIVCWEAHWPNDVPRPTPPIIVLQDVVAEITRREPRRREDTWHAKAVVVSGPAPSSAIPRPSMVA